MLITIQKNYGTMKIHSHEIENLIVEQLKMVPGIISVGKNNIISKLKSKNFGRSVTVQAISYQTVVVVCHVNVAEGINFKQVATEAQNMIKFSVEKKYGLKVETIDIYVDGFVER